MIQTKASVLPLCESLQTQLRSPLVSSWSHTWCCWLFSSESFGELDNYAFVSWSGLLWFWKSCEKTGWKAELGMVHHGRGKEKHKIFSSYIYLLSMCCMCVQKSRTQLLGVDSLKHESNSGHQAWWQGCLPAELIHWLSGIFLIVSKLLKNWACCGGLVGIWPEGIGKEKQVSFVSLLRTANISCWWETLDLLCQICQIVCCFWGVRQENFGDWFPRTSDHSKENNMP